MNNEELKYDCFSAFSLNSRISAKTTEMTFDKANPVCEPRITYLDGLRGVAAAMVALSHFVIAFYDSLFTASPAESHFAGDVALGRSPLMIFYSPFVGVALFFVLSGFVISASISGRHFPLVKTLLRRWVRLCVPVMAVVFGIYLLIKMGAFNRVQEVSSITRSSWMNSLYPPVAHHLSLAHLCMNCLFTFLTGFTGTVIFLNAALWTMPIELVGSFGVYFLYYFTENSLYRQSARIFPLALIAYFGWETPYYGFFCGVVIFEVKKTIELSNLWYLNWLTKLKPVIALTAFIFGVFLGSTTFALDHVHIAFLNVLSFVGIKTTALGLQRFGAVLLFAATLLSGSIQRVLFSPICQYLGKISFMLYLLQIPVLCTVGTEVFLYIPGDYNLRAAATLIVYLTVTIVLADLTTRFIDLPITKYSKKI